ncbi:hypothetical protein ASG35_23090 [Burkholderia sp. Leaf177]|nr:hypothetical protein ASG35_23090 [Burkholderia sp. Leaf177]
MYVSVLPHSVSSGHLSFSSAECKLPMRLPFKTCLADAALAHAYKHAAAPKRYDGCIDCAILPDSATAAHIRGAVVLLMDVDRPCLRGPCMWRRS